MKMNELLENPEKYRCGANYKATNIVFPVEFEEEKYIIKKHTTLSTLANVYYKAQDLGFFASRKLAGARKRYKREVATLQKLNGLYAPTLIAHQNKAIVREFVEGVHLTDIHYDLGLANSLRQGFLSMQEIHSFDIIIGDAHVKNILIDEEATWIDFDSVFDESDIIQAKAIDVLKFIYSIYTVTRDLEVTLYAAEVAAKYDDRLVNVRMSQLVSKNLSAARLWVPTRISYEANEGIKKILQ